MNYKFNLIKCSCLTCTDTLYTKIRTDKGLTEDKQLSSTETQELGERHKAPEQKSRDFSASISFHEKLYLFEKRDGESKDLT